MTTPADSQLGFPDAGPAGPPDTEVTTVSDWPTIDQPASDFSVVHLTQPVVEKTAELEAPVSGGPFLPLPPAPHGSGVADGFGWGMIIGILLSLLAATVIAMLVLNGRHSSDAASTTTVAVAPTSPASSGPTASGPRSKAARVAVPALLGRTVSQATQMLENEGFRVRVVTVPGRPPAGAVTAESPVPGRTPPAGSVIRINVSNGAKPAAPVVGTSTPAPAVTGQAATTAPAPSRRATASVPSLSGDVQGATQALSRAGLRASIHYLPGPDGQSTLGMVKNQGPSAGDVVPAGSHVTVNVSSGPGQKPQETVPDVSGMKIPDALRTLNRAGLRLILLRQAVGDKALAGSVVEQTPAAGQSAPKNAQVLVYMAAFQPESHA